GFQIGPWVGYDQSGDTSVVYYDEQVNQGYLRRFDPSGTQLGSTVALTFVQGIVKDMAELPDGNFILLWNQGSVLDFETFNADGSQFYMSGSRVYGNVPSSPGYAEAKVAISSEGEFSVVVARGGYLSEQVYYARYSNPNANGGNAIAASYLG